ncbi:hypothetical protein B0H19DRAFT_1096293 [Mycena capillaripes]|nr:hypothetical protein B0H19DRAFT_1096293 [Mycena capillaripes]
MKRPKSNPHLLRGWMDGWMDGWTQVGKNHNRKRYHKQDPLILTLYRVPNLPQVLFYFILR